MKRDSSWKALVAVSSNIHNTTEAGCHKTVSPQPSGASASSENEDCFRLDHHEARDSLPPPKRKRSAAWERGYAAEHPEGTGTSGEDEPEEGSHIMDRDVKEENEACSQNHSSSSWDGFNKSGKKQRMIWTSELHRRFVNAVNHLGMKNAVPKTILRMMNVDGVTRENVASHLQKYRQHLKKQAETGKTTPMPNVIGSSVLPPYTDASVTTSDAASASAVRGIPMQSARNLSSQGLLPVLGLPVDSPATKCDQSATEIMKKLLRQANIPAQAWAAGVPGYDALQGVQMLSAQNTANFLVKAQPGSSAAVTTAGLTSLSSQAEGLSTPPVLDIAPLSTAYRPATRPATEPSSTSTALQGSLRQQ